APRSLWQRAYVERVIGTIRRECLDHVIVFNEASLYRHVEIVRDVLSRIQNAPLIGQGLARITGCAAARAWTDRSDPTNRRSPSPVRTARSLKGLKPISVCNQDECECVRRRAPSAARLYLYKAN